MDIQSRSSHFALVLFSFVFISLPRLAPAADPITHQIALPTGMTWCDDGMINGLFTQINTFRSQKGAAPLNLSPLGMKDAEIRATQFAAYMATANPSAPNFNPHQGYDTTAASLGYDIVSENLAYLAIDPAYIVGAIWQDSLHLAAMLSSSANVDGVSCVYYNGTPYWTYEPGVCVGTSCAASITPNPTGGIPVLDTEEWAFLTLINNYRAQNGLGPLQVSVDLENAARWMSNDMAAKNYFSHTDSLGRSTGARLVAFGYSYSPWGENLAAGYSDAQNAFNQWESACDPDASGNCTYAHRKNMLGAGYTAIGIARASGSASTYGWYWTTDFGGYVDQVINPGPSPSPSPVPTITAFTATPASIISGQTATVSWSVTGATAVTINNGIGTVPTTGSVAVKPAQSTTYTLTATDSAGSVTAQAVVTVATATGAPVAPTLSSAVAKSPTEVDLAWTAGAGSSAAAGYQILRNGSAISSTAPTALSYADTGLNPGATYTYSIVALGAAGNNSNPSNSLQATTPPAPAPGQTCPAPASGAFTGCYYPNLTLSGSPVLVRTDGQISFDWGFSPPNQAVPTGPFSVQWQGQFMFSAGTYTFTAITSDGMRVYIDGALVINRWYDQPAYIYTIRQTLTQGTHLIAVTYYDNTGWATAHLTWQNNTPAAQLPSVLSFTASPSAITAGHASNLSWIVNGASSLSIDNGVGDVTGLLSKGVAPVQTTTYTLTASNSAGTSTAQAKVTISPLPDNQAPTAPVLVSAVPNGPKEVDLVWSSSTDNVGVAGYQILRNGSTLTSVSGTTLGYADKSAAPGTTYLYIVKAVDAAGNNSTASNGIQATTPAAATSGGTCPPPASGMFTGCYYNDLTLSGNPVLRETAAEVNFDWGSGSPATSVTPDSFSARWQGYFNFDAAVYSFVTKTSDGVRLYIDGQLVIDHWQDQPLSIYQARPTLTQGSHLITLEYYAHTGSASCHLTWRH